MPYANNKGAGQLVISRLASLFSRAGWFESYMYLVANLKTGFLMMWLILQVTDTTDKTPAASPSQRKRKYLKQRKEPRPVSLNSEVSDVTVPLAPNEDPSVTPYISTDCMHSAKSDRLHENTNNSLNKRILAGHSRNPSGSRSFIDTPYMENTKANEEYARSVSESKCK